MTLWGKFKILPTYYYFLMHDTVLRVSDIYEFYIKTRRIPNVQTPNSVQPINEKI